MPWNQSDLDEVERAIASGVRTVRFHDGSEESYRTIKELLEARDLIKDTLDAATEEAPSKNTHTRLYLKKGWG